MGEMRACNFAKAVNPTAAERATGRQAGIIYLRLPRGREEQREEEEEEEEWKRGSLSTDNLVQVASCCDGI